ncbi:conserved hypothetical protein [Ricinus communis]|uniref:Uncharacterized protein n=1 Tax=Ricinus communis TaxID=3988 RepID=B9SLA3_RICCO|nr:conserved hypothetical protein [Ricinus communis]
MAQINTFKGMASLFLVVAMYFASVEAQELGMAPAPSPTMDKGAAAYSFGISGAMICTSLVFSLLAFLKH